MKQSARPNGKRMFGRTVDRRILGVRRAEEVCAGYIQALGGPDRLNIGEEESIKRLASLTVLVEREERLLVDCDPKYNPDVHLRAVGNIRRLIDDLDIPKRTRAHSGNGDDDEYEDDKEYADLEEFLADPKTIKSAERPISAASIGAARRKRARL